MDINYESYKVFYYVAETLSFSEASKKLYISQSAVSQSVKALEQKLGCPLFVRSTKNVQLTPAGQALLKHVGPAVHLIQRGESQILNSESQGLGPLYIGAPDTVCRYFLAPYLKQFHQKFPHVPIKVFNAPSAACVGLLEQGKADLIVTNDPNPELRPSCVKKITHAFQDVFVANPDYFDLKDRELSFTDLCRYPVLMLNQKSSTSEFLRGLFLQQKLALVPEIELASNDLLIDLARIGLGIAFVPDYCLFSMPDDLFVLRIKEPIPPRRLAAATHPGLPVSASAEEFLKLLPEA